MILAVFFRNVKHILNIVLRGRLSNRSVYELGNN
jgi:hypothetical protein